MVDRKVKVGIIGCGVIANLTHGPEYERLKDQVEVIAACDIDPQALASFCERFHIPRRYATIAEMLGDPDIEAVDVCLHNNMHAPVSIEAMRRGKDVYCEKPMAGSYTDAVAMLEASKQYGRKLHIQLAQLYSAGSYAAKELIDHGQLGHIYHMRSTGFRRRGRPYVDGYGKKEFVNAETSGGGALLDMGVYHISQLLYLTGNPAPQRFVGHAYQELEMDPVRKEIAGYNVEELITGMIDFDGGLTMDLIESWAMHLDTLECSSILGSLGGVRLDPFSYHYTQHDIVFNATIDEGGPEFPRGDGAPGAAVLPLQPGALAGGFAGEVPPAAHRGDCPEHPADPGGAVPVPRPAATGDRGGGKGGQRFEEHGGHRAVLRKAAAGPEQRA